MSENYTNKKKAERDILDLVYSEDSFASISSGEKPDFRIKHKHSDVEFGVEITEFFISQSHARINKAPGFVNDIINQGEYKDDDYINPLSVGEFKVVSDDGTEQKVKGIHQKQPGIDDYIEGVIESINDKNERFSEYIDGLNHVNLIIYDNEHRLAGVPSDKFYHFFFKPELENALLNSKFREIFIVTEIGSYSSAKKVYIPLKMLFLVAEMYRFNHIVVKNYSKDIKDELEEKEPQLASEYMKWRGVENVFYKIEKGGHEILYGNSGVFVGEDNEITVRDHHDHKIDDSYTAPNSEELQEFFDDEFEGYFEEDNKTSTFSTELHFPQKS